jgi:hypothetical protein
VWDYKGETSNPATGEINGVYQRDRRSVLLLAIAAMQFADYRRGARLGRSPA